MTPSNPPNKGLLPPMEMYAGRPIELSPIRALIARLTAQAGQRLTIPLPETIGPPEGYCPFTGDWREEDIDGH